MPVPVQQAALAVKRLQWRHHRAANTALLAEVGVSLVQWDVLRNLHAVPQASLHDLAQLAFQTDQSMGALAARMVSGGLLRRVAGPGRAVRHQLTERGEQVRRAGSEVVDSVFSDLLAHLDESQLDHLHALLTLAYDDGAVPAPSTAAEQRAGVAARRR